MKTFSLEPVGQFLRAVVPACELGFAVRNVWNPSPSRRHRVEPYPVPQALRIGVAGTQETGAKFSPPPFAVVAQGFGGAQTLVALAANPGSHLWNTVDFNSTAEAVSVSVDLEGHTTPASLRNRVRVALVPGLKGESSMALLRRGLMLLYPPPAGKPPALPAWWRCPIYCGWGDQVTAAMFLEGVGQEPRALAYCIQGLYERWIRRLEQARVPVGTVIIDAGWSPAGLWEPDTERWPDLKGFIARQHKAGRRVLLWLATWLWKGLPEKWCVKSGKNIIAADPTNPEYMDFIRSKVRTLISPDGYDADGFKIDQLAYSPSERTPIGGPRFGLTNRFPSAAARIKLHGAGWGCELLHRLQKTIYQSAKRAKPDALVTSSTVHPYFRDTFDMVRLHDMGHVADDIFEAMGARADLARAALPGFPIDTDDWIHTDYRLWMKYTSGSRRLGVPCIFYAERFMLNWRAEPATKLIPLSDLRRIAKAWTK